MTERQAGGVAIHQLGSMIHDSTEPKLNNKRERAAGGVEPINQSKENTFKTETRSEKGFIVPKLRNTSTVLKQSHTKMRHKDNKKLLSLEARIFRNKSHTQS